MQLDHDDRERLQTTLACTSEELDDRLKKFGDAANDEYVTMLLGRRVFTRGQDILEYRLVLLIEHVFDNLLPSVDQVSAIFKTTPTQSRSMLRSALAKYAYELTPATDATVRALLASAKPDHTQTELDERRRDRLLTINNASLVEVINERIRRAGALLPPLVKRGGTSAVYVLGLASYNKLIGVS